LLSKHIPLFQFLKTTPIRQLFNKLIDGHNSDNKKSMGSAGLLESAPLTGTYIYAIQKKSASIL